MSIPVRVLIQLPHYSSSTKAIFGNFASVSPLFSISACRKCQRDQFMADFESLEGFEEVVRMPSPSNSFQKKSTIQVKLKRQEGETYVLCLSSERVEKDRAIREKQEGRLLEDLAKLDTRIAKKRLVQPLKIGEAMGRLKERYPRVARYYDIAYNPETKTFTYEVVAGKRLPRHEKSAVVAPRSPPGRAARRHPHISIHSRLSPSRRHREDPARPRRAYVLADTARHAKDPPSPHRRVAHRQRRRVAHPQRFHARGPPTRKSTVFWTFQPKSSSPGRPGLTPKPPDNIVTQKMLEEPNNKAILFKGAEVGLRCVDANKAIRGHRQTRDVIPCRRRAPQLRDAARGRLRSRAAAKKTGP